MEEYGPLLKRLLGFTGLKMSAAADALNYDLSYISKWCNQAKLPGGKHIAEIDRTLAALFAGEILRTGSLPAFRERFSLRCEEKELEGELFALLEAAWQESARRGAEPHAAKKEGATRFLTRPDELYQFFHQELIELLCAGDEGAEVLCTMDLCRFLDSAESEPFLFPAGCPELHVSFAVCQQRLFAGGGRRLLDLYAFLNRYAGISFSLYDDALMDGLNTIVVKGRAAVICSLNTGGRITAAAVTREPETVNQLYIRLLSSFRGVERLMHAAAGEELSRHGYRTDFYSRRSYQIFTAAGFEFLLPVECWEPIIRAAEQKNDGGAEARMAAKMQITWEEVFENAATDFFATKSSLMKYLEDGEITFLGVRFRMSPAQRKLHIRKILQCVEQNPDIRFCIIDDDRLPGSSRLCQASLYSNRQKVFLKNLQNFSEPNAPQFYCIDSDVWIDQITSFLDRLRENPLCHIFDAGELRRFAERYGSLIDRILDLGEEKA